MKKMLTVCAVLAVCLSVVTAVLGQTPLSVLQEQTLLPTSNSGGMNSAPITPEQKAKIVRVSQLSYEAASFLHTGNYAQAEATARQAVAVDAFYGAVSEEVLATALDAQGRDQEALQAYQYVVNHVDRQPRNLLPYAVLLLKSGQWVQALAIYNQALPELPSVGPHLESPIVQDEDVMRANFQFSPDTPQPTALAVALHIAHGIVYNATPGWAGDTQNKEAMGEYTKALQLAPDNALANFYYGQGWQQLSPAEQSQFATAQQARAALQKAVMLGKGEVKKAAQKALQMAMKPR